ncbi:MAG: hypothetical protein GWN86_29275 [Desulfobacterales bacterium]|nr:hypothetical protein [Desulfobacterales bacterium]
MIVIPIGEELKGKAMEVALMLREARIPAEVEVMGRTVSRALEDANRREATHTVLVGPEELTENKVVLRDMQKREQKAIQIEDLLKEIEQSRN